MGKFKLADGGTLFLDEIGDMPLSLQPKLLRALQEGEIEPLGSNKVIPFDARVIAATSRDLAALVREGKFREDLFYRLNVLPIRVPPLRERSSDIPALVEVLAEDMALRSGSAPPELSAAGHRAAVGPDLARQHPRTAQRAGAGGDAQRHAAHRGEASGGGAARVRHPADRAAAWPAPTAWRRRVRPGCCGRWPSRSPNSSARPSRRRMAATGGNKVAAAKLLGISRAKLYERLESLSDIQTLSENKTDDMCLIFRHHVRSAEEKSF